MSSAAPTVSETGDGTPRRPGTRGPIPPFTAAHDALRSEIRSFVAERLRPHAEEWEAAGWFPNEVFGWLAQAGYLGLKFPRVYGGGDDTVAAAVLVEELARCGSGGVAAGLGAHAGIALPPILAFGTDEQKERYLIPGLRGELIAALAITEPDAGSDVASLRTRARAVDGGWVVNGAKTYITGGVRADVLVCAVATTARERPPGDLVSADRPRGGRFLAARCASSAGTPPTPRRSASTTCSCPRRTCSEHCTAASI